MAGSAIESFTGRSSGIEESLKLSHLDLASVSIGSQNKITGHDDGHGKARTDGERWLNIEIALYDLLASLIKVRILTNPPGCNGLMPHGWRASLTDGFCVTGDDFWSSRPAPFAAGTAQTFAEKRRTIEAAKKANREIEKRALWHLTRAKTRCWHRQ